MSSRTEEGQDVRAYLQGPEGGPDDALRVRVHGAAQAGSSVVSVLVAGYGRTKPGSVIAGELRARLATAVSGAKGVAIYYRDSSPALVHWLGAELKAARVDHFAFQHVPPRKRRGD